MKRTTIALGIVLGLMLNVCRAEQKQDKTLDIYFLDMAGGASTLIVTPLGQSVLIDTGSLKPEHRDVDRICRACKDAGVKRIDYLITTHFHSDHYGGILELARRIPVGRFMDKGAPPPAREQKTERFKQLYELYKQATKGDVTPVRAGDDIPLRNNPIGGIPAIKLHCVASEKKIEGFDGDIDAPVEDFEIRKPDDTDNARSIALVLTYGKFKFFAGGDITWNVEHHLAHPTNRIGKVHLYQVTHHGLDQSNNPILLKALSPTACVAMNGPTKGIQPNTFKALNALPSIGKFEQLTVKDGKLVGRTLLAGIYQIHYNTRYGDEGNTDADFIANPKEDPDKGQYIKASVRPKKGTFTIAIGPDGTQRTFPIE
jgi:competence protein ComEC